MKTKRAVKAYVIAYRNGVKIGRTLIGHSAGGRNSRTNVKKIKVKKTTYELKVGKSAKIKAKTVKERKRKKLLGKGHCARLRYVSSDQKVATVNGKGKIKAVGKGKCDIWIYAQNGRSKKVTVVVR